jgi:hypothetical protein
MFTRVKQLAGLQQMRQEGWCLDPEVFIEHPTKGKTRAIHCIADYFVPKQ